MMAPAYMDDSAYSSASASSRAASSISIHSGILMMIGSTFLYYKYMQLHVQWSLFSLREQIGRSISIISCSTCSLLLVPVLWCLLLRVYFKYISHSRCDIILLLTSTYLSILFRITCFKLDKIREVRIIRVRFRAISLLENISIFDMSVSMYHWMDISMSHWMDIWFTDFVVHTLLQLPYVRWSAQMMRLRKHIAMRQ